MRLFALLALFALPVAAQVPAHSVVGTVTLDVTDISIPVAYGAAETKAVLSICSSADIPQLWVTVGYNATDGTNDIFDVQYFLTTVKTGNGSCASVVANTARAGIPSVDVQEVRTGHFAPSTSNTPSQAQRRK
jgi:hypothetical protein